MAFHAKCGHVEESFAVAGEGFAECGTPRAEELNYLRNKTESYILLLETLITARRAYIAFGGAFRLRGRSDRQDFLRRMDDSMALFTEARQLGRKTTEKFAEVVDHPSDLGVLYRANLFLVTGMELVEQTIE